MSAAQRLSNSFHGLAFAGILFSPQTNGSALLQPATAASVEWKSEALLPTTSMTLSPSRSTSEALGEALDALSMAALAHNVFPESRSMNDWEKQVTDDFYLSHFR